MRYSKIILITLVSLTTILFSCSKENDEIPTVFQPRMEICNFIPDRNYKEDIEKKPVYSTPIPYDVNSIYKFCILLKFKPTYIKSSYWNGGKGFTTKQIITDTLQMRQIRDSANKYYSRWSIIFTTDTNYYKNFYASGLAGAPAKDVCHIVSRYVRTDNTQSDNLLVNFPTSGVTYVGCLTSNGSSVNDFFVFADMVTSLRDRAAITLHESGHACGLTHQSEWSTTCTYINEYRLNTIMGNGLSGFKWNWIVGPTPYGCNIIQNDTSLLNTNLGKR